MLMRNEPGHKRPEHVMDAKERFARRRQLADAVLGHKKNCGIYGSLFYGRQREGELECVRYQVRQKGVCEVDLKFGKGSLRSFDFGFFFGTANVIDGGGRPSGVER